MRRGESLAGLLLVVGLGLLVYGQFFMLRPGAYLFVADEPTSQAELDGDATVVEYDALPPAAQGKFEQRLDGQTTYLGPEHEAEEAFPGELGEVQYVRYRDDYYEIGVTLRHPTTVPRSLVIPMGGLFAAIGGVGLGGLRIHKR